MEFLFENTQGELDNAGGVIARGCGFLLVFIASISTFSVKKTKDTFSRCRAFEKEESNSCGDAALGMRVVLRIPAFELGSIY